MSADDFYTLRDQLLRSDPEFKRLYQLLSKQQDALRAALTPEQFKLYLDIEETTNNLLGRFVVASNAAVSAASRKRR